MVNSDDKKITEIVYSVARKFDLEYHEAWKLIKKTLEENSEGSGLVDLLGFDMMEEILEIVAHKDLFITNEKYEENENFVEFTFEKTPTIQIPQEDLVDVTNVSGSENYFQFSKFNSVQSKVFHSIYKKDDNILVCAPTGSGKTVIGQLGILRAMENDPKGQIIYIVPMKALATEITQKYAEIFPGLVVEYTGDTKTSKTKAENATIVICTPEKFDVASRRLDCVFRNIRLVIIDEIHLLDDIRGHVLESIVARLWKISERQQKSIRLCGLSATMPNYGDIGKFIRAKHVFFFDEKFRPVSLEKKIVGFKKTSKQKDKLEYIAEKISQYRSAGKQSIVFVTSRNKTVKVASQLKDLLFVDTQETIEPKHQQRISQTVKTFIRSKIGIHHAGLHRNDRLYVERCFTQSKIDLIVSTATLAWGVNLPAHAVFIYETSYYNPEEGRIDELSILDVLQIFGRAGRPQYDTNGCAYLITEANKLDKYVAQFRNSREIESKFLFGLVDNVLAEIYLGNVRSMADATEWLKSTFLYIRCMKYPVRYGFVDSYNDTEGYANVISGLEDYLSEGIARLRCLGLIERSSFVLTWLGVVATYFYVSHQTVKLWMEHFSQISTERDLINTLICSTEFASRGIRKEDVSALTRIHNKFVVECILLDDFEETAEFKCLLLLLSHFHHMETFLTFSLKCDLEYIVENLQRLVSAFKQMCLGYSRYETYKLAYELESKIIRQQKKVCKKIWNFSLTRVNKNYVEMIIKDDHHDSYDSDETNSVVFVYSLTNSQSGSVDKNTEESVYRNFTVNKMFEEIHLKPENKKSKKKFYRQTILKKLLCVFETKQKTQKFIKTNDSLFLVEVYNNSKYFVYNDIVPSEDFTLPAFLKFGVHNCSDNNPILLYNPIYPCNTHNILSNSTRYNINFQLFSVDNCIGSEQYGQMNLYIGQYLFSLIVTSLDNFCIVCRSKKDALITIDNLNTVFALDIVTSHKTTNVSSLTPFGFDNVNVFDVLKANKKKYNLVIFKGMFSSKNSEIIRIIDLFRFCRNSRTVILEKSSVIKYLIETSLK